MATILITGANRGLGLAMAALFAQRGDAVIATCRESSPELDALRVRAGVRIEAGLDVARSGDLHTLDRILGDTAIDTLVLNAGVLSEESLTAMDDAAAERIRHAFEVNALAPVRLAALLHPRVPRGGRIVLMTSRMGSIADNGSGGYYGYRMSKAALNAASRSLALDLRERGIAVIALHPGYVRTRMTGGSGDISAEESAAALIARIDELDLASTGTFRHSNGQTLPW
jgi:NAD(P)-dependent dehydrogenase (short-subunit alcohol dehydrogenase family)